MASAGTFTLAQSRSTAKRSRAKPRLAAANGLQWGPAGICSKSRLEQIAGEKSLRPTLIYGLTSRSAGQTRLDGECVLDRRIGCLPQSGRGRFALRFILYQVRLKTLSQVLLLAFRKLLFDFIKCEVHHV